MSKLKELTKKLQRINPDLNEIKSLKILYGGRGLAKLICTSKMSKPDYNIIIKICSFGLNLTNLDQLENEGVKVTWGNKYQWCYWEIEESIFLDRESLWKGFKLEAELTASQIYALLKDKASKAFKKNVLEAGVLEKCSAISAKSELVNGFGGTTDSAIWLLQFAGDIADNHKQKKVCIKNVDEAYNILLSNRDIYLKSVKRHRK